MTFIIMQIDDNTSGFQNSQPLAYELATIITAEEIVIPTVTGTKFQLISQQSVA